MFGNNNPTHFTIEWVPIIHEVEEGYTFDWGKMLSDNLAKQIGDYRTQKSKGEHAPFYMSEYINHVPYHVHHKISSMKYLKHKQDSHNTNIPI